ncbi:MAG: dipeptidyl aminopeptidase/acylaminoacyl peptidase [Myxococcota bacterium]|jgi:dipeptidyl aminopeptidase/acylaminoacyl peptidase
MSSLFLLLACNGGGDGAGTEIAAIRVEPAVLELTVTNGEPGVAEFSAVAELLSGGEAPLELVSWSISNLSSGTITSDGEFTSVDTNGGITEIIATHDGIEGAATVAVVYKTNIFEGDLSESVAAAFEAASIEAVETLTMDYPPDQVTVPRNLTGLSFIWTDQTGISEPVYRIRFRSDITDISVYTTTQTWPSTRTLWELISAANKRGEVEVTIESAAWDGEDLGDVRQGPPITLTVNRLDARGSVLYWATSDEAIRRIPFGSTKSELFWEGDTQCTGCHALVQTEDGTGDTMVVTHGGVDGRFSVIDVADPATPEEIVSTNDTNRMTFKAVSPDGQFILGTNNQTATLYELRSGNRIKDFQFNDRVTHPDWSPDGETILMVLAKTSVDGQNFTINSDMEFQRGEIIEVDWNADAQELGDMRVLKAADTAVNFYYPAYSPDGEWIAYNRSALTSYAAQDAELWLMSRDGSIDVRLKNANGDGDLQNSYPRWGPLPDDDVLWLAFSSKRTYAVSPNVQPQIWVAAILPELAEKDEDPSSAPFWLPGQDPTSDNHLPVWWSQ